MKIKLHNSMAKIGKPGCRTSDMFLFDNKISISIYPSITHERIYLAYGIYDMKFFLSFFVKTKDLVEADGFGLSTVKSPAPKWWKDGWEWKEI